MLLDKETERQVVKFLREINLLIILEHPDQRVDRILKLVEKMPAKEREIISRKYLNVESDYTRHYEIYRDMGISDGLYRKIRLRGLCKIYDELMLQGIRLD